MYIPRSMEKLLASYRTQFKVVLVTGARQVGKTTMLQHSIPSDFHYSTLDNPHDFSTATRDSALYFQTHPLPVLIDEVQRVPELFTYIKYLVDQQDLKGQIVLTGSQTYPLMTGVSESLAGRVGILELPPLSLREILHTGHNQPYIPHLPAPTQSLPAVNVWEHIWRGSMPELQDTTLDWDAFYSSYERSYLERDVRALINVKDEERFFRFLISCAARTGQLFNASGIAADIGVDSKSVQNWLSVLRASGLVRLVQPFFSNPTKQVVKSPKLYFMDTGLVCHLLGWTSATTAQRGAMSGALFETFVVSEIIKSHLNAGQDGRRIFFYRDTRKREIDLVIQNGRTLHPIEIKQAATPSVDALRHFSVLDSFSDYEVGAGAVICQTDSPFALRNNVQAIPVTAI
ncbi:MAG: ATP-binding protein [Actinomycetaceae bacterium]|nr:ATP-binding protein [Actinomycetaceae bacterium]